MPRVSRKSQPLGASPLTLRFLGLASVIGASIAMPASQSDTLLTVSATVAPQVDLVLHSPDQITVTASDLARGFAVMSQPVRLELSSNTSQGVELDVHSTPGLFSALRIEANNLDATLSGEGGTIAWRWPHEAVRSMSMDLRFTFMLNPHLQPGAYTWPISVNGRALETRRSADQ